MTITIHFFRNRNKERMDYQKLIEYFETIENCRININDELVEMVCTDSIFDFQYHFLITKRSRVESIYRLNSDFFNLNLLVEIPVLLPEMVSRNVFKFINELCQNFELQIYYNGVKDIEPFDMAEMINYLANEKNDYLEKNPNEEIHYLKRDVLHKICNYQQMMPYLQNQIKEEVTINPYIILLDSNNEVKLSITWRSGMPMLFPPYLDYIHVEEEDEYCTIIPASSFFKYNQKHTYELKNFMPDIRLLLLNSRSSKKAGRTMRKLRKEQIPSSEFKPIKLIDLIEK